MIRSMKNMKGFSIKAIDGKIGEIEDFLFDDENWIARYLVIDTGDWLMDRLVLVSPSSIKKIDLENETVEVTLDKQQIEDSPKIESDKPVSRQHEHELANYYNWPNYWISAGGAFLEGPIVVPQPNPTAIEKEIGEMNKKQKGEDKYNPHLRSINEVLGYNIHAKDGEFGHVEDFMADEENWNIKYLLIDSRNWFPGGRKVLILLRWIEKIVWSESRLYVSLKKKDVENSPDYDYSKPINREIENKLHDYYKKDKYWEQK